MTINEAITIFKAKAQNDNTQIEEITPHGQVGRMIDEIKSRRLQIERVLALGQAVQDNDLVRQYENFVCKNYKPIYDHFMATSNFLGFISIGELLCLSIVRPSDSENKDNLKANFFVTIVNNKVSMFCIHNNGKVYKYTNNDYFYKKFLNEIDQLEQMLWAFVQA